VRFKVESLIKEARRKEIAAASTGRRGLGRDGHLQIDMKQARSINSFNGWKNGLDRNAVWVYFAITSETICFGVAEPAERGER
jgi:hypothetical protein